ncbi:hypothetical protein GGR53DRAFT_471183 [Hypoxylon sp. FL1150]|nr:hypothetical protein GGR53DRAFT_471183 [Hypoxylon sp. FL1150]
MKTTSCILGFLVMGIAVALPISSGADKHEVRVSPIGAKGYETKNIAKRVPVDADENIGNVWYVIDEGEEGPESDGSAV